MSDKQVRDYDKFMLRLPDGMRDSIADLAKKHGRSMNAQIVHILEEYITPPKVDDMPYLTDAELKSSDKVQEWMNVLSEKISIIEKVVKKNFPE
ncbi:Arc family DNA-binding protein [Serratia sp. M24T3]|uniref:Arc family DNA-binding protein n=1 Tax=Serratia sp. M24T3 TaxID=932213 RepID=UPI00025B8F2D|nr:Arc family DNA-binding protein [Serratia sp. M24T3]EIC83971.1 putative transcriptional regulator [Serratia sp. M24T3]